MHGANDTNVPPTHLLEAKEYLNKAVKVDPKHPRANYQLAVFLYDNKQFKDAIKYLINPNLEIG